MKLILGSGSPRRKEILDFFSLDFAVIPSSFDERQVPFEGDPVQYAKVIAEGKAADLAKKHPDDLILTADTVVFYDGNIYNKPTDKKEATEFLTQFAGNWVYVFTAVCLQKGKEKSVDVEEARLLFNPLTPKQIESYYAIFPFADRSGAVTLEKGGAILFSKLEGCFYNAQGLPVNALKNLLLEMGIDLWEFLRAPEENSSSSSA